MSVQNSFQKQAEIYLGLTGLAQPIIETVSYTPTTSGEVNCTINGATGFYNNTGQVHGYISFSCTGATGHFTFALPSSYYTEVPAVVVGLSGNDILTNVYLISVDQSANDDVTVSFYRVSGATNSDLRVSFFVETMD